ncbi:MAG: hypothetical protein QGF16_02045 [Rhodospirillales bacterium]|jgi:hypothetical protein|nr:hypothetical protein [Rhodospirillales bacterium]
MACEFYLDLDVNCVFFRHTGPFDIDEIFQRLEDFARHPEISPGINVLRDMRESPFSEEYRFDHLYAHHLSQVRWTYNLLGRCKSAWIAGSARDFGVIHRWVAHGRLRSVPQERRCFRDIDTARKWLEIPEDYKIE